MKTIFYTIVIASLFFITSCGGNTTVVESGTYEGTIQKVVPAESEIYLELDNGDVLELYFIEETKLTKDGNEVEFSMLEEEQKVEVEVEKVGQRLDPLTVKILE